VAGFKTSRIATTTVGGDYSVHTTPTLAQVEKNSPPSILFSALWES
jgi:hypothetical protein